LVNGSPTWSPDGRRIAFDSNRQGNYEIYTMKTDGSDQLRLTRSPADDGPTSWSPNGQTIAFDSGRNGNYAIYEMNTDGSDQRLLTASR
jgi:Tol biopolymer transport system component